MNEKSTKLGKICPMCKSYVRDDLLKCPVCGYEFGSGEDRFTNYREEPKKIEGILDGMNFRNGVNFRNNVNLESKSYKRCPKCGMLNSRNATFCKNCRHKFDREENVVNVDNGLYGSPPTGNLSKVDFSEIHFLWSDKGADNIESRQGLEFFKGKYFDGEANLYGYCFLAFRNEVGDLNILIRKMSDSDREKLYMVLNGSEVVFSGSTFYLGNMEFILEGKRESFVEKYTSPSSDVDPEATQGGGIFEGDGRSPFDINGGETVVAAPGKKVESSVLIGAPKVRLLNYKIGHNFYPISDEVDFGREYLVKNYGLDGEFLRNMGVSRKHVRITPLVDGYWMLTPISNKGVFLEIGKVPKIINLRVKRANGFKYEFRWVINGRFRDFSIEI